MTIVKAIDLGHEGAWSGFFGRRGWTNCVAGCRLCCSWRSGFRRLIVGSARVGLR